LTAALLYCSTLREAVKCVLLIGEFHSAGWMIRATRRVSFVTDARRLTSCMAAVVHRHEFKGSISVHASVFPILKIRSLGVLTVCSFSQHNIERGVVAWRNDKIAVKQHDETFLCLCLWFHSSARQRGVSDVPIDSWYL